MFLTKIITLVIGVALLVPFGWVFTKIVFRVPPTDAELRHQAEAVAQMVDSEVFAPNTVGTRSDVVQYMSIHQNLIHVWLWSPRKWIGLTGILGCFLIMICIIANALFPVTVRTEWNFHSADPNLGGASGSFVIGDDLQEDNKQNPQQSPLAQPKK